VIEALFRPLETDRRLVKSVNGPATATLESAILPGKAQLGKEKLCVFSKSRRQHN
jgi:hypothetical protein